MGDFPCEFGNENRDRLTKMEEKTDRMYQTFDNIDKSLVELNDTLNHVYIKNGDGRKIRYERDDFHQMTYDKLKWNWRSIVKELAVIVAAGIVAAKSFGVF